MKFVLALALFGLFSFTVEGAMVEKDVAATVTHQSGDNTCYYSAQVSVDRFPILQSMYVSIGNRGDEEAVGFKPLDVTNPKNVFISGVAAPYTLFLRRVDAEYTSYLQYNPPKVTECKPRTFKIVLLQ